jgi:hypothetical protein
MPKPLGSPVPSSAVARLLEPGSASAALAPAGPRLVPPRSAAMTESRALPPIKREFVFSPAADEALRELLALYQRAIGGSVTHSHLLRALFQVVAHALPEIERQAALLGPLRRPSNARGDELRRQEFERQLAHSLCRAFRAAPPLA